LREPVYLATLPSVESAIEIKIDLHSDSGVKCSMLINPPTIIPPDCDTQVDAISAHNDLVENNDCVCTMLIFYPVIDSSK